MDSLPLSILEDLSPSSKESDPKDVFVYEALVENSEQFTVPPTETLYYTKTGDSIEFNELSGLKKILIPIDPKKKTGKKKKKPVASIIGSDLVHGFEDFTKPSLETIFQLNDLFSSIKYAIEHEHALKTDFNIISLRRNLLLLMTCPLSNKELSFNVIYWRGLIIFDYNWQLEPQVKEDELTNKLQYSGFQFERIITDATDDTTSFYTFVSHAVNEIPIHFTAEIDATKTSGKYGLSNYIELKTHTQLKSNPRTHFNYNFQKKLLRTWCQNKLVDCTNTAIGFRSSSFTLSSIQKFEATEMAKLLNSAPVEVYDGCQLNTTKIFKWYKLAISAISKYNPGESNVCTLKYNIKDIKKDSGLSFHAVDEKQGAMIIDRTIPRWFQDYFK